MARERVLFGLLHLQSNQHANIEVSKSGLCSLPLRKSGGLLYARGKDMTNYDVTCFLMYDNRRASYCRRAFLIILCKQPFAGKRQLHERLQRGIRYSMVVRLTGVFLASRVRNLHRLKGGRLKSDRRADILSQDNSPRR